MTPMSPASRYRAALPQLGDELFLTDGGLETTLIFHRGIDLPEFSAFDLLKDEEGIEELRRYFISYLELAKEHDAGFILESPTWRASPRWGEAIGYSADELDEANRKAIALMAELRDRYEGDVSPIVISGNIGPQDDGYDPKQKLSADQAADYHSTQIGTFADTESDMVTALTLTYVDEAIGIARAAADAGIPAAISFTLETDGRLPSGQPLSQAIGRRTPRPAANPPTT
jgi:homocysteine S-methyltransferase